MINDNAEIMTIKTQRGSMRYFCFGEGTQAFVILPGLSIKSALELKHAIMRQYDAAAKKYTVYLFDRREDLPETYTIDTMAEDTAEAMRAIGLSQVYLFGTSQGGMMAQVIAVRHPDLVKKLVLASTAPHGNELSRKVFAHWIDVTKERDGAKLYLETCARVWPKEAFENNMEALKKAGKRVTEEDFQRFEILTDAIKGFDILPDLPKISCPVFVIGAEDDEVLGPKASYEIAEVFKDRPDCDFYMYDGYAHAAFDFAPDYLKRVLSFTERG